MSKATDTDPIIEEAIEEVLNEYKEHIPPSMLPEYRRLLRLGLETHAGAQDIMRRLHRRPAPARSGDVVNPSAAEDDPAKAGRGGGS